MDKSSIWFFFPHVYLRLETKLAMGEARVRLRCEGRPGELAATADRTRDLGDGEMGLRTEHLGLRW